MASSAGLCRVEVQVPASDVATLRKVAADLRAGGKAASRIRESVPREQAGIARTGRELVDILTGFRLTRDEHAAISRRDRRSGRRIAFD